LTTAQGADCDVEAPFVRHQIFSARQSQTKAKHDLHWQLHFCFPMAAFQNCLSGCYPGVFSESVQQAVPRPAPAAALILREYCKTFGRYQSGLE
jgi:hypothetical protein